MMATHAYAGPKLDEIFAPDMLQAQVPYLETITGPAKYIRNGTGGIQIREYPVEGCRVLAYAKDTEVEGYSLDLKPACNINLGKYFNTEFSTQGLTIEKFTSAVGAGPGQPLTVQSDCISMCGNAADPTVDFAYHGPHAVNFLTVIATVILVDKPSLDAADEWRTAMKSQGEGYVINTRFNCDHRFDAFANRAFANVPVYQLTIGYEPNAASYAAGCKRR